MTNLEAEAYHENEVTTVRRPRRGHVMQPNQRYFGDQWVNYQLGSPSKTTKASIDEKMCVESFGRFVCEITYSTILRTLQVSATATSKKGAKAECCKNLLSQLKSL